MIRLYILLIGSLLILGCSKDELTFPEPSAVMTDGAYVSETGNLKIGDAEYVTEFGMLTVAENRQKKNSRFIHLPVIRVFSTSEQPLEPVFYLSGGPGSSNMHGTGGMWYLIPDHDIISVGYRGVDGSSILDCPEVSKAMKGKGGLFSKRSMENIEKAWRVSAERLMGQGVDLDGYNMVEVIHDNELAREALEYDRINLRSASYGTRVAYIYGLLHPEAIHRSAMLAVNPPGRFVWEPDIIDEQLRNFSNLWSNDSVMSMKMPDLYQAMQRVIEDMPDRWLFFPIDEGKVRVITLSLLWKRNTAAAAFDSYVAASLGDYSGIALMTLAYNLILPGMSTWGDLASKAVSADYDPARDYISEMEPPGLPLGSPISKLLWGPLQQNSWPIKPIPEGLRTPQNSDVETLLISGSIDMGTPARFATDELLPHLRNGEQVILSECGHMDYQWPNPENTRRILTSFYNTGIPDVSLNNYNPMDFSVKWGFPRIMKLSLAIAVLIVAGFVLLVRWLLKRFILARHH